MSGRDGRLPSSSRPHHGGSHHTSSRDNGRSRDKDRREIVVEPERGASGERKPHKPSVGLGPSGSRLWPPEEQEEEQEEDGEVPSSSKVGLPPLSEGRRSSGNSATGNPNPNPNRNPSPNPYRNPSPNHNPNPHRNPSPNPYRNPSPSHNPNPNPSPSTNPSSNLNPNRNPSPNHNCNPNPNPSTSTNPNPNPNRNRNLSPNPNHNPSPNPSSSPSPKINSNSNRNPSLNHNPSPSNNPNLYPNPSPSPNPNPNSNPNPSPSPGTGPSRLRVSRRSSVEKEPGELSSGSSSEDSGAEMDRPSCSPKRPLPDSSSGGASPYRKRKYSPIVWDLDEKNQKLASSSLPLPPPPPLLPPHLQTTPNPPSHPPAVSRPRLTSCSPSPHAGSDGKLESGQLLSSPRSMDEKEEKEEEEEEESMPHINIAASRWADEEEDNDLSPPREEKASKRVKGWSRSIDNGRNGGNGGNSLLDNGMAREGSEEYPQEKTELIGVGGGGAGVDNRDEEDRDFSNEEFYERERNEKEFGDDEDMASEDEAEQRSEDLEEEETRPTIPPAPPQRAIDMLQGCRSVDEFERLNKINEGTYGVVYRARNKKTGEIVALKKVKMEREREGFPLTSLREINVLLSFHHPSIVDVKEVVVGSNLDSIFMVMEYMEHDLKGLMETMKQPFSQSEVKCLMLQLLEGVKYLHDNWVLHRDLKTSNLLLNNCGELKICDFGLARQYGSPLKSYTHMVVTLWYRAPELLLGAKQYSTALDMWSVGCIMAELLSKEPLINGKNELDQLDKIFKTLGTPSEKIWPDLPKLSAKCNFTRQPYNRLKEKFPQTSFSGRPTLSLAGLDLLNRFLTYDPKKRITAEEALQHEWFKEVPLPSMKELMPTFPARSEHERRVRRLMKSPDPLEEQRKRELLQAQLGPIGLFG